MKASIGEEFSFLTENCNFSGYPSSSDDGATEAEVAPAEETHHINKGSHRSTCPATFKGRYKNGNFSFKKEKFSVEPQSVFSIFNLAS